MRIQELLENFEDKNHNGINDQLEFDLADDLFFFLKNNDDVYRRHVYPSIMKFKQGNKSNNKSLFSDAVTSAYECYAREFPIKNLPAELPEEIKEQVCDMVLQELQNEQQEV